MTQKFIYPFILILSLASCSADGPKGTDSGIIEPTSCNSSPIAKGTRLLGIDLLDINETGSFDNNLSKAEEFRYEFVALHVAWTSIETQKETYEDPGNSLTLLNDVVNNNDLKFSLTIRPIDITGKTVPSDLATTRFNDPEMIQRFKNLLDFVLTRVSYQRLTSLQVGNEIDGYNTSLEDPEFWSDYGIFLTQINAYLDASYPGLKMGYTGTFHGMTKGPLKELGVFTALATAVDILGVTYYPINSDFSVMSPDVINNDLNTLIAEFPSSTIYLQEVGYQTSETNQSSNIKQSQFVCDFFSAWDDHTEAIQLVNWVRLNDVSATYAQELAGPYDINGEGFTEYLRTLGLRTYDGEGTDKEAFGTLVKEATKRGW